MVKAASPVKICRNHWDGDTPLIGAGVGSILTRDQIFLITSNLAQDVGGLDLAKFFKKILFID